MKKFIKLLGIIALAAVIGFTMTACPTDGGGGGGGGGGNSGLNGTWVNGDGEQWVLNNGNLTIKIDGVEAAKGTYTTNGNNITVTISQVSGAAFGSDAAKMGLSPNQWYTKSQFRTAIIAAFVNAGYSQSQAAEYYDEILEEYPLFDPMSGTYSLSGNTLTIDGNTFTRQGGTSGGGGGTGDGGGTGGAGGTGTSGWPPDSLLSQYGLSGLTAPQGATNITYMTMGHSDDTDSLHITFNASSSIDNYVHNWFISNGWEGNEMPYGGDYMGRYTKTGSNAYFNLVYHREGNRCEIASTRAGG